MALENEHVFNGRYRIDHRLGVGGMAIVYSGTDLLLRRQVAIKVLRDQYVGDDGFVARFEYEAQAAAKLAHPNIVSVFDRGREGDAYYIVMELVEGTTLAEMLRNGASIPESVAIDYATQIAAGLAKAHQSGILHRDVKPANILITSDDVVKISDFGIARAAAETAVGVTQPGMVMGSVAYISPEQAQGRELDERSDLYSLGVVLYQMVTGRLPFEGETPVAVALKHVSEPVPRIDPAIGVSPALAAIVERLLAKSPSARYSSAADLARALREARDRPSLPFGNAPFVGAATRAETGSGQTGAVRRTLAASTTTATVDDDADDRDSSAATNPRWFLVLAVAFVLAVALGFGATSLFAPVRDIEVGDYATASATQAQQQIAALGLRSNVQLQTDASVPIDRVIRQEPTAGTKLARSETVTLFVSSGPPSVAVPDVKGFVVADAQRQLNTAKLHAKVVERYDASPKGTVLDVDPMVGTQTPEGSDVTLIVSKGAAILKMPQLVGMTLNDARDLLTAMGLKLNVDAQTPNNAVAIGTIVSQSVAPDTTVPAAATVGVTVSSGTGASNVPNVVGKSVSDASSTLSAAGYEPNLRYVVDPNTPLGTVTMQEPVAGASASTAAPVAISVAVPGTIPDVSGLALGDAKRILARNGYLIGQIVMLGDGQPGNGKVVRTDPGAGRQLDANESVTIYYRAVAAH